MELDELKQGWERSAEKIKTHSWDIQSLITDKQSGPVTALRNRFRRGMIIVPLVIAIALSRLSHHHNLAFNVMFCFLMVFALSMVGYFFYNYKLLGRLQAVDITVKEHLQKQATLLEKGVRFRLIFTRAMAVVFILLLELLMYRGKELTGWNDKSLTTRLTVYAVVLAIFYLITHLAVKHRYSKNISHLKELVNELE